MADRSEPPIGEALMALFAGAAPLIERAKAAGLFRVPPIDLTASPPAPPAPPSPPSPSAPPSLDADAAKMAALHDIIVAQATKIVALEAEIAKLKA